MPIAQKNPYSAHTTRNGIPIANDIQKYLLLSIFFAQGGIELTSFGLMGSMVPPHFPRLLFLMDRARSYRLPL